LASSPGEGAEGDEQRRGKVREKIFLPWGSAQLLEKVGFGQGNARKSKAFSFDCLCRIWPGLAGFG
jgi:hypothetical protein